MHPLYIVFYILYCEMVSYKVLFEISILTKTWDNKTETPLRLRRLCLDSWKTFWTWKINIEKPVQNTEDILSEICIYILYYLFITSTCYGIYWTLINNSKWVIRHFTNKSQTMYNMAIWKCINPSNVKNNSGWLLTQTYDETE